MPFTWTPPDPLDNTAETRSIFITELQEAANVKRAEINQSSLTFIDQSIGKIFREDAIEELKTVVSQLALDFGYTGGIENVALLGRPYVTITKKFGQEVAHFPIINDLRQILNLLEVQFSTDIQFVATDWFSPTITIHQLANWNISEDPWETIPLFVQLGAGTVCIEGPPTCDNTIPGTFTGVLLGVTDRSIIFDDVDGDGSIKEGPLGGLYFTLPDDSVTNININNFDSSNIYYTKVNGSFLDVISAPRNVSNPTETVLASLDQSPPTKDDYTEETLVINDSKIFIAAVGARTVGGDIEFIPRFSIIDKSGGFSVNDSDFPFLDISGTGSGFFGGQMKYMLGKKWSVDSDGNFIGVYAETQSIFDTPNTSGPGTWYVGSAMIRISPSGGISTFNVSTCIKSFANLSERNSTRAFLAHSTGHNINASPPQFLNPSNGLLGPATTDGVYLIQGDNCATWFDGDTIPNINSEFSYNAGSKSAISGTDYKGDSVVVGQSFDLLENWTNKGGLVTSNFSPITFDSTNRVNVGASDNVEVTWTHFLGAFRYRLQRRLSTSSIWVTTKIVELTDAGLEDDVITGLNIPNDYFVRILVETGQGLLTGDEIFIPAL